jgi:hypothetical protein
MRGRIVVLLNFIVGLCAGDMSYIDHDTLHGGMNGQGLDQELIAPPRRMNQLDVEVDRQNQALVKVYQSLKAADQTDISDLGTGKTSAPSFLSPAPSSPPSTYPTMMPSALPSDLPSLVPSSVPSDVPSYVPSAYPSSIPSSVPSIVPSDSPSDVPSNVPSATPSFVPSLPPSSLPTVAPAPDLVNASSGPNSTGAITGFSVAGAFLLLGGVIVGRRVRTANNHQPPTGSCQVHAMDEEEGVDLSIVEGPQPSDITGSVGVLTPRYGSASCDEVDRYFPDEDCATPRRSHRYVDHDDDDDNLAMTGPFPAPEPYSPHNRKHQAIAMMINSQADTAFRRPSGLFSCPEEHSRDDSDSENLRASRSL